MPEFSPIDNVSTQKTGSNTVIRLNHHNQFPRPLKILTTLAPILATFVISGNSSLKAFPIWSEQFRGLVEYSTELQLQRIALEVLVQPHPNVTFLMHIVQVVSSQPKINPSNTID